MKGQRAMIIKPPPRNIRAGYDVADSGGSLATHWMGADNLSPDAAASQSVRRTMRSRARYETQNNSYAKGIVSTLANYIIGTGPQLRLVPVGRDKSKATEEILDDLSDAFDEWGDEIGLAKKLHTMQMSKATDGEALGLLRNDSTTTRDIKLDFMPFETDFLDPGLMDIATLGSTNPDGIVINKSGYPIAYNILQEHPGGGTMATSGKTKRVSAQYITQWFDVTRPGLHHGIPEISPALPMFAMLRRYTIAVVTGAETAADFAAVMQSDAPADSSGEEVVIDEGTMMEINRGMVTSLPKGWTLGQVKAENPTAQHEAFIRCMVREIGRSIDMPYAVAAMDASGHNYSSMRGDWQAFFQSILVRRGLCGQQVLRKILSEFLQECAIVLGYGSARNLPRFKAVWDWPDVMPLDPVKRAAARKIDLSIGAESYDEAYAKKGINPRQKKEEILKESAFREMFFASATPKEDPKEEPKK